MAAALIGQGNERLVEQISLTEDGRTKEHREKSGIKAWRIAR